MDVGTALRSLSVEIKSDSAGLDAQVLLAGVLGRSRTWVLAHPEAELSPEQYRALEGGKAGLGRGMPLPYVLGHQEFFGLDFGITPGVLIPRPETELLVEHALDWLGRHPRQRTLLDVGTGSGCIAVSLASRVADLQVVGTDLSPAALDVARANAQKFGVAERIRLLHCDLMPHHTGPLHDGDRFGLIVANLPYIPSGILPGLAVYNHEPTLALDGGADGLALIRRLFERAPAWLAPGGALMLEMEASQGLQAIALAGNAFAGAAIELVRDLAGRDRLLKIHPLGSTP